ncbi:MAG: SDR family oxidoreductase [Puniceicoccales bacterium]|jgi:enoyl-[acyl-carrier protein] reductase I|nr:SDR family oxidoreductase [Puniceicoccales bacterium]
MDYLQITGKNFLITGVANKKSVAWHIAQTLETLGAKVFYSVRSAARRDSLEKLLAGKPVFLCDAEDEAQITRLAEEVSAAAAAPLHGLVHSIAFANYAAGPRPFHETERADFLQATAVSAFSLVEMARAFKPHFDPAASVVSIGISSQVTAASYGYMSPVKAALESASRFLAKSFSADTHIRFNMVNAGPLKTSASAGIPGYVDNYLFAEQLTMRKKNVATQEVADAAVWLLSPRSSGVNAQSLVVDAGMGWNFFDESVVKTATRI